MKTIVRTEEDTIAAARELATTLNAQDVICLHGDLGMGKTVFARALIRALVDDGALEVPSPTFTLVQTYEHKRGVIYHYDLYRLEDPEEVFELAFEDALAEGLVIIEWPERLGAYKPRVGLDIRLSSVKNDPHAREILIERR